MARRATDSSRLRGPRIFSPRRGPGSRARWGWVGLGLAPALVVSAVATGTHLTDRTDDVALSVGNTVTLIGHGFGHGRGMGQYGAFGYAKRGWRYDQILAHYYGGTSAGKVDNPLVSVTLTQQPTASVRADAGARVGGQVVAPGQAVRLSGSTATITAGCGGGVVRTVTLPKAVVDPVAAGTNRPANELLRFCGNNTAYRGSIGLDGGRVVNIVGIDDYVKGVTPKESPARWADQGGAEALKAQAVAARTYALAAVAKGKKIDDTMMSQVYGGASGEDPRTNAAADATAGQIRVVNGQPAFTEFSSSTGGYTAGVNFPAVVDDGDTESPNHNWTATVGSGSIASAFGVGTLRDIAVTEANGLGAENGRATKVRIVGSSRTVETTGDDVRSKLQLKSAWFTVQGQPKPRIVAPPAGVGGAGTGGGSPLGGAVTDVSGGLLPSVLDAITKAIGGGTTSPSTTTPPSTTPSTSAPSTGATSGVVDTITQGIGGIASNAATQFLTAAIAAKIAELGGPTGLLGQVLSPVIQLVGGAMQKFANGTVYFSPETGAHALAGSALTDFVSKGAEGVVGFPANDALGG
ncbi:SpoIID/LytB domain-containing protein [Williamsia serinedens]|uniref:SpoIID/LytB domain protein n=1 Tax=Williamsia serinedens TaxID=391736 RepID=A0ABT1GXR7_9NOCA|nr:SpoIID/LytB domain-containing protein [Williamsia serinedens]MCP2159771.1 SpoIID/LytB domain protein [Williamsia serinedens]